MTVPVGVVIDHAALSLADVMERVGLAVKTGVSALWIAQLPNQRDVALLLAALAPHTFPATVGTAVLPIYTCPPVIMAQAALTLDEICHNRLVLGLGRGHRLVGEWMLGARYASAAGPMREYLEVVLSLIRDGEVSVAGTAFGGRAVYSPPRPPRLPVYLGSFGPRMLELAGELADGVILWMCTPSYVRDVVMPSLQSGWARRRGGHDGFAVVTMLPAVAAPGGEADRECGRTMLSSYLRMENYQRLLKASGFGDDVRGLRAGDRMVDELCAIGSGQLVQERIIEYREAGVTEVALAPLSARHYVATLEAALAP